MIRTAMLALAIGTMAFPLAATAQAAASAAAPLDPARVAAARELIDVVMPPATREQMVLGMMKAVMANVRRGLADSPEFSAEMKNDPQVRALFDRFLARQEQRSTELMREALPGMVPAMANAYARRFTVQQIHELKAFFETPTGHAYTQQSLTIMSDPDIAAWQRDLMTRSMANVQQDVAELAKDAAAMKAKRQ